MAAVDAASAGGGAGGKAAANDDPRLKDILTHGDDGDVVIVGFPYDEGVRRNGGRVGARDGPDAVRRQLPSIGTLVNPELDISLLDFKLSDSGNVAEDLSLEEAHAALRSRVGALVQQDKVPFVIGGGNDQSYANVAGLLDVTTANVGVINIDAHFDVRPLKRGRPHSGSPFRLLLDDKRFDGRNFVSFAAQGGQCSAEHYKYLKEKQASVVWMSRLQGASVAEKFKTELDKLGATCGAIFVSFDLDAISGSDAPGVSCTSTYGLTSRDALDIAFAAGAHERVMLMDVSEFNPTVESHRTGRLVCNMLYYFLLGQATKTRSHNRAQFGD